MSAQPTFEFEQIAKVADLAATALADGQTPQQIVKSDHLKSLYAAITQQPNESKASFGKEVNTLKLWILDQGDGSTGGAAKAPIDVTAPFDVNVAANDQPELLSAEQGSIHPLSSELNKILSIFEQMGFAALESRQLDDDYHMFGSLNFPDDHPARDDFDTFMTDEGLIAPAHTSTMQTRILKDNKHLLEAGRPIQYVVPGRCFRNEDVDARHEHTLHQVEGVYVDKGINAGNLMATLKTFLEAYYQQDLEVRTQPAYFPFVEPGFEFAMSCPFCNKQGCQVCSNEGWIELLGCGVIHPNVLREGGIDPEVYTGFAWGCGLDRLVMMKHNIEDIRWLQSGKFEFLEQF